MRGLRVVVVANDGGEGDGEGVRGTGRGLCCWRLGYFDRGWVGKGGRSWGLMGAVEFGDGKETESWVERVA